MTIKEEKELGDYMLWCFKVAILPFFVAYVTIDDIIGPSIREFKRKRRLPSEYKKILERHGLDGGTVFFNTYSKEYPTLEEKLIKVREDYINNR